MDKTLRIVTAAGVWACALLLTVLVIVQFVTERGPVSAEDLHRHALIGAIDAQAVISGIDDSDGVSLAEGQRMIEATSLRDGYLQLAGMRVDEFFSLIQDDAEMRRLHAADAPDPSP
ncbi:MAG: hypothetical protein AAGD32_13605 [Planctomycetota bacterium]